MQTGTSSALRTTWACFHAGMAAELVQEEWHYFCIQIKTWIACHGGSDALLFLAHALLLLPLAMVRKIPASGLSPIASAVCARVCVTAAAPALLESKGQSPALQLTCTAWEKQQHNCVRGLTGMLLFLSLSFLLSFFVLFFFILIFF